ncbi:hypothetical protein BC828DRAFT_260769 [Blastocladiella britannica]|nr:hypothetical protein BC828DRAFT_260769 [Blastocladiella britannica]
MAFLLRPSLLSTLTVSAAIQTSAYLYSTVGRPVPTEHYYDLSGSLTHLAIVAQVLASSFAVSSTGLPPARVAVLGVLSSVWAARLGTYLYDRVKRVGKDTRFDELKQDPIRWTAPWAFQTVWCAALQAPLTMAAASAFAARPLSVLDAVAIGVFVAGFAIETLADRQKNAYKTANPTGAMTSGAFAAAVYPNYFGECLLWWGAYALAAPVLVGTAAHATALAAPLVTATLLFKVSGIPLLEKSAWTKYGSDPNYVAYRARTNVFFPWFPRTSVSDADWERVRVAAAAVGVSIDVDAARKVASSKPKAQ